MRRSLSDVDDIDIVDVVGFGPPAVAAARTLTREVILVTVGRPPNWALTTIGDLAANSPESTIVALVDRWDEDVVHSAVRAGVRDVLRRASSGRDLGVALTRARRAHLEQRAGAATDLTPRSIVAVFSAKGGVGCTTVATNLALGLANASSARVTLVDMHLSFGDVALAFNLQPARSIVDALNEGVLDDDEQLRAQLTEVSQALGDLAILGAPPASWPGPPIEATRITPPAPPASCHQSVRCGRYIRSVR